jgi:hypothetical protein
MVCGFAEIADRKKKIEYREIKPYWTLRLNRSKNRLRPELDISAHFPIETPREGSSPDSRDYGAVSPQAGE